MDMKAALDAGYSLAEVNAEAARRTGFKYDAAKAEGYSDDDINLELAKRLQAPPKTEKGFLDNIVDGLKKASNYQEPVEQKNTSLVDQIPGIGQAAPERPAPTVLDKVYGTGEAALSQAATLGGSMLAWPAALGQAGVNATRNAITGSNDVSSPPELFDQYMQGMYQPKTDAGQSINASINENVTRHLMGAFPALHDAAVVGEAKKMRGQNKRMVDEARVQADIETIVKQREQQAKAAAEAERQAALERDMQEKRSQGGEMDYVPPEIMRGPELEPTARPQTVTEAATIPELGLMDNVPKEEGLPYKQEVGAEAVERGIEAQKQAEIEQAYRQKAFDEGNTQPSSDTIFKQREQEQAQLAADDAVRKMLDEQEAFGEQPPEPAQGSSLLEKFSQDRTTNMPISRKDLIRQRGAMDLNEIYNQGSRVFDLALSALSDKVAPILKDKYPTLYKHADGTPRILLHATKESPEAIYKKPWDAREIDRRGDLGVHLGTSSTSPHVRTRGALHKEPANTAQDFYSNMGRELKESKEPYSKADDIKAGNERVMPYVLDAERVPFVDIDAGAWDQPRQTIPIFVQHGILSDAQGKVLFHLIRESEKVGSGKYGIVDYASVNNTIRKMLKGNGVKAIEYRNSHETIAHAAEEPTSILAIDEGALIPLSDAIANSKGISQVPAEGLKTRGLMQPFEVNKYAQARQNTPAGQRKIADAERGSINIFGSGKKGYEEYARRLTEAIPGITKAEIDTMWGESTSNYGPKQQLNKLAAGIVPVEKGKISFEKISQDDVISALKTSEDSKTSTGYYRDTLMPGGYMPAEFTNNPGLKAGYRYLKSSIDRNARKAEDALFKAGHGIISLLNKEETVFGPGRLTDLTKEWWKSKDNPDYVPNVMDRHKGIDAAKTQIFDTMRDNVNSKLPEGKQIEGVPFYIPSIHDGKWYVEINAKGAEEGRPVLYGSNNKFALAAKAKQLEMQGHTVSGIKERGSLKRPKWAGQNFGDVNEVKAANFQYMLDLMGDQDPAVVALAKEITRDSDKAAMNTAGANQRLKEYKGFKGNLGNNPFKSDRANYFDTKKALINTIESHYAWMAAQDAAALNKAMLEQKVPEINRQILEKYIYNNVIGRKADIISDTVINGIAETVFGMGPQQVSKVAGTAGNVTTAALTAFGSPVHALQNVVQPATVIFPHIFKEGGNYMDMASAVSKIPAEYLYVFGRKQVGEIAKLVGADTVRGLQLGSDAFKQKMRYAEDAGIINPTIVDSAPMFKTKVPNKVADFAMQGVLSRPSEQAARWAVFSSMYDLGIRKGKSAEAAATRAREITETYMVDYGPDAKAQGFVQAGHLGAMAGRLQSFAMNQMAQTIKHIKDAPKSKGDLAGALTYFGVMAGLGGVGGMVGFDIIEKLVNSFKATGGKTFSLRNEIRSTVGDYALSGVWGPMGLNAAPSFAARSVQDSGVPSVMSIPVMGRMGQVAETVGRRLNPNSPSWENETEMEKGKELLSVTPVSAKSFIENKYLKPQIAQEDGSQKTVNISPISGRVLHEVQPGENRFANISSAERGKDSELNNQKFIERTQLTEQNKKMESELSRYMLDINVYGNSTPAKQKHFENLIEKYLVNYGHSKQDLERILTTAAADANISDAELSALRKMVGKTADLKLKRRVEDETRYMDLRKPQKGIFNFGTGKQ